MRHRRALGRRYGRSEFTPGPNEFRLGESVRVKQTHGSPSFRGKTGIIVRYVPFSKYYVQEWDGRRILVDVSDLEAL